MHFIQSMIRRVLVIKLIIAYHHTNILHARQLYQKSSSAKLRIHFSHFKLSQSQKLLKYEFIENSHPFDVKAGFGINDISTI